MLPRQEQSAHAAHAAHATSTARTSSLAVASKPSSAALAAARKTAPRYGPGSAVLHEPIKSVRDASSRGDVGASRSSSASSSSSSSSPSSPIVVYPFIQWRPASAGSSSRSGSGIRAGSDELFVNETTAAILRSTIKDTKLGVIATGGPFRSGKSYLENRIILRMKPGQEGFAVGHTVNACTRGIWISIKPVPCVDPTTGEKFNSYVLDTEGMLSTDANQTNDVKIFALALLLSSYFIYNATGPINESALQHLALVCNITRCVRLTGAAGSASDKDGKDAKESQEAHEALAQIGAHMPSMLWLARDFSLELKTPSGRSETGSEYLERMLSVERASNAEAANVANDADKASIRRRICSTLPERDFFSLVCPCSEEQDLRELDHMADDDERLKTMFIAQVQELRQKITTSVPIKKLRDVPVSIDALIRLAQAYVHGMNAGMPVLHDCWTLVSRHQRRDLADQCMHELRKGVEQMQLKSPSTPLRPWPIVRGELQSRIDKAWADFRQRSLPFADESPPASDAPNAGLNTVSDSESPDADGMRKEIERVRNAAIEDYKSRLLLFIDNTLINKWLRKQWDEFESWSARPSDDDDDNKDEAGEQGAAEEEHDQEQEHEGDEQEANRAKTKEKEEENANAMDTTTGDEEEKEEDATRLKAASKSGRRVAHAPENVPAIVANVDKLRTRWVKAVEALHNKAGRDPLVEQVWFQRVMVDRLDEWLWTPLHQHWQTNARPLLDAASQRRLAEAQSAKDAQRLHAECDELRAQVERARKETDDALQKADAALQQQTAAQDRKLSDVMGQYEATVAALTKEHAMCGHQADELKRQLAKQQQETTSWQTRFSSMQTELDRIVSAQTEALRTKDQLRTAQSQLTQSNQRLEQAGQALADARRRLDEEQQRAQELEDARTHREQAHADEARELRAQIEQLKRDLKQAEQASARGAVDSRRMQAEMKRLGDALAVAQTQSQTERRAAAEQQSKLNEQLRDEMRKASAREQDLLNTRLADVITNRKEAAERTAEISALHTRVAQLTEQLSVIDEVRASEQKMQGELDKMQLKWMQANNELSVCRASVEEQDRMIQLLNRQVAIEQARADDKERASFAHALASGRNNNNNNNGRSNPSSGGTKL